MGFDLSSASRRVLLCLTASGLLLSLCLSSVSAQANKPQRETTLTPEERGQLIRAFVMKWGVYASTTYRLDVSDWATNFVPQFAKGNPSRLRRALARTTYQGALLELDGMGEAVSDDKVIDRLARLPKNATPGNITNAFGEIIGGLVYTPVQPCRILDTRNTAEGTVKARETRRFFVSGVTDFAYYGGDPTDCGLVDQGLKVAVLNVTVVNPVAPGFTTIFNTGLPQPVASSINYQAGAIISNAVTTSVFPGEQGSPGRVSIFSSQEAHYVVDIVGYYEKPLAVTLDCTTTEDAISVSPGIQGDLGVACPAGYSVTGGGAYWLNSNGGSFVQRLDAGNIYEYPTSADIYGNQARHVATGFNSSQSTAWLFVRARCCRVPGRQAIF